MRTGAVRGGSVSAVSHWGGNHAKVKSEMWEKPHGDSELSISVGGSYIRTTRLKTW